MGLVHEIIHFVARDELAGAIGIVMDQTFPDSISDRLGDLGPGRSVQIDKRLAVMHTAQGGK